MLLFRDGDASMHVLVRVYGKKTECLIDRERELHVRPRCAAARGACSGDRRLAGAAAAVDGRWWGGRRGTR